MSDPHGIANAQNEYFYNISNELKAQFTDTDDQYLNYLPDEIIQNLFLQPITASQVKCEILELNSKKSPGGENIGTKIIQPCHDVSSPKHRNNMVLPFYCTSKKAKLIRNVF